MMENLIAKLREILRRIESWIATILTPKEKPELRGRIEEVFKTRVHYIGENSEFKEVYHDGLVLPKDIPKELEEGYYKICEIKYHNYLFWLLILKRGSSSRGTMFQKITGASTYRPRTSRALVR